MVTVGTSAHEWKTKHICIGMHDEIKSNPLWIHINSLLVYLDGYHSSLATMHDLQSVCVFSCVLHNALRFSTYKTGIIILSQWRNLAEYSTRTLCCGIGPKGNVTALTSFPAIIGSVRAVHIHHEGMQKWGKSGKAGGESTEKKEGREDQTKADGVKERGKERHKEGRKEGKRKQGRGRQEGGGKEQKPEEREEKGKRESAGKWEKEGRMEGRTGAKARKERNTWGRKEIGKEGK